MIIFLYGEDTFRSRQKLKEIKDKFLKEVDPSGNSIVCLEGENLDINKLNEIISASSLFARRSMVIIEKLFATKNKLLSNQTAEYLSENFGSAGKKKTGGDNENIVIFWEESIDDNMSKTELFNFLSHQKFAYSFKQLSATDAIAWVKKECERRGAKLGQAAASRLSGLLANNLWQLDNEINKLISFKSGSRQKEDNQKEIVIDEMDINSMVRGNFDENIFALTDAIGNKNKILSASLFEKELEAGVAEINLLFMIIRQFRIMLLVRQCLDKSYTSRKIASALKLHPFVIQKSLTQVRNFPLVTLKRILNHLIEMDKEVKTGQTEAKTALSVLLAKI